jgi:hypothetical protein
MAGGKGTYGRRSRRQDGFEEQSDGGLDPLELTLHLANGMSYAVPTRQVQDREGSRTVTSRVPDLRGFGRCDRCDGGCTRDGAVEGGWLMRYRQDGGTWYTFARACPQCVWGAYRRHCTGVGWHDQFADCNGSEIAHLGGLLKSGRSLREAAMLLPDGPMRMRILRGVDVIEGRERAGRPAEEEHAF